MSIALLCIPLVSALLVLFLSSNNARIGALLSSLVSLGCTVFALAQFNANGATNYYFSIPVIPSLGFSFSVGLDGISLLMVLLCNLLMPLIILSTKDKPYTASFFALMLLMQGAMLGSFMSLDGLLFYIFWELALLPIYFICALWGDENRVRVTIKFFIYTFLGSLFMLLALLYVYLKTPATHSFAIESLYAVQLTTQEAVWVLLGFFVAFAIKMPIFPFHTWQPATYLSSPYAGTMLLSGIMLKMGTYGVLRWMLPMAPEGISSIRAVFIVLAIISVVYAGIIAIRLNNIKQVFAYSSISHIGLIGAALFACNLVGWQGALIQMLCHGINIVGLWWIAQILERRTNTKDITAMGGLASVNKVFAVLFMIILLGSTAVPLTNGFVGEFLCLHGLFQYHVLMSAFAGLTVIVCAVYMLRVYQKTMFGELKSSATDFFDLDAVEYGALMIIAFLVLLIGVFPQPILRLTEASAQTLLNLVNTHL